MDATPGLLGTLWSIVVPLARPGIVAGMTLGTVVVEANLASGALITANFATEYGRQVFAVPGRIDPDRIFGE